MDWLELPQDILVWGFFRVVLTIDCVWKQIPIGYTSAGCIVCTDRVGCVLFCYSGSRSRPLSLSAREAWQSNYVAETDTFLSFEGCPSGSIMQGLVYRLTPEMSVFRGMPTGPKAFSEPPRMFVLLSCAWLHHRKVLARHVSMVGCQTNY